MNAVYILIFFFRVSTSFVAKSPQASSRRARMPFMRTRRDEQKFRPQRRRTYTPTPVCKLRDIVCQCTQAIIHISGTYMYSTQHSDDVYSKDVFNFYTLYALIDIINRYTIYPQIYLFIYLYLSFLHASKFIFIHLPVFIYIHF